jgi:beta-lactamase class A
MRPAKHPSFFFLLSFLLLLSACAPTPTAAPTPTSTPPPATPTSTPPPTPIATLVPTATEIPETDILTRAQKERLYQASLAYLASTQEEAFAAVERLNFVQYPSPSNMCGPLAIAELRDAGLLSRYTDLHDFWQLRPDTNAQTIARTFPSDRFEHYRFTQSIREFDFKTFPLKAGDFLYLYAGDRGTFEHILTVTRVDEQGRAYTVTNLNTQPYPNYYYVIKEVMLYDPSQPGVGEFYEWTDSKNNWIGMTGFGGFDVWRFSAPVQDATSAETALAGNLDSIFKDAGGEWHSLILDLETGRRVYDLHSTDLVHVASVIKVPVAMLLFASLEQQGVPPAELSAYLAAHGDGYLLSQLLRDMLVISDELATIDLLDYIRQSGLDINATLSQWGAADVNVFNRTAPLEEIAALFAGLYNGDLLSPEARRIILDLMAEHTPNDDTRLGVLMSLLPTGGEFYNKRGTITVERLVLGDAAIVAWPSGSGEHAYVMVLFGYPGMDATNDLKLAAAIEQAALAFWDFAK